MKHLRIPSFLFGFLLLPRISSPGQIPPAASQDQPTIRVVTQTPASQLPDDAPRIQPQTRDEIIRDLENQVAFARTTFPMGATGLRLQNGIITPSGQELEQLMGLRGPAVKPGDPALITLVQIMDNYIHIEINGGPIHSKKWYQHVQVSGSNGTPVKLPPKKSPQDPHGTFLDIHFDKYVPEMTVQQLRELLLPVFDFKATNKEEAYLDTVPPKVKEAILAHQVLVGMNSDMVLHAFGPPLRKVRENENEVAYEEWIYGEPPQDMYFIRIVGDKVVRVEILKVSGEKIVRSENEVEEKKE
jgi:hypothetical protein